MSNIFIYLLFTFVFSILTTKLFSKIGLKTRFIGYDAFKRGHPKISSMGGVALILSIILSMVVAYFLGIVNDYKLFIGVILSFTIVFIIGFIDDLYPNLPGYYKPVATMFGAIPIILLKLYNPILKIFDGIVFRLSIVYPVLIFVSFAVVLNTVNMLDVINGSAATGTFYALIVSLIVYFLRKNTLNSLTLIFISILAGFLILNLYPAKIFLGNSGSLILGTMIMISTIISKTEFPVLISMMPFIHNSFFYLNKVKGFIEHRKLKSEVTHFDENSELIIDACNEDSPLTLLRFIVAYCPKKEYEAFISLVILFTVSSALAVITFIILG